LVDRLESLVSGAFRLPLGSRVLLDEDELLDIIDQMRIVIPDEMREASRIRQERDRIIAQGQEEAERVVSLAQEEAYRLIGEHRVMEEAQRRAQEIVRRGEQEAGAIREGAEQYALQVLGQLDRQLLAVQDTVRNGLETLQTPRATEARED
jgi:hypothetical protein